jgi:hypothetical protein
MRYALILRNLLDELIPAALEYIRLANLQLKMREAKRGCPSFDASTHIGQLPDCFRKG